MERGKGDFPGRVPRSCGNVGVEDIVTPPPPPSAELLMEHRAFLQGLSRSLVVDEQRAEDVVQQTYLAVLQRPPPAHVRLRAWLAVIARNLALRSRRTEGRMRRRHEAGARPEAVEPTSDVAARVEAQKRVAGAVAALPEPGRSAIVWRYFDGLTPTQIAEKEGVSVRTIESRLRRARETLRRDLDGDYGGRILWQAALLPVAGWGTASASALAAGTTSTATTAAQGSVPTASAVGTAAAVGATIMSVKTMVGVAVVCAVGAFFAGWQLKPSSQALVADGTTESANADAPLLGAEATRRLQVESELKGQVARNDELVRELAALRAKVAEASAEDAGGHDATTGKPGASAKAAYAPASVKRALEGVDWAEAGVAITKLMPLLTKLEAALRDEVEMKAAEVAGISRWNSPLLALALRLEEQKVGGTGANGAFTHPSVIVNLLVSALAESGKPVSQAQLTMLSELGDRFLVDDERRTAGYNEETLALERTIGETELKQRFYESADALLTTEQRDILRPATLRGRLGVDLFSSGVIWHPLSRGVNFEKREDLASRMAAILLAQWEVPVEQRDVAEEAARTWANGFTDAELKLADDQVLRDSAKVSGGVAAGWAKLDLARASARQMLAMQRALLERLPVGSAAAKKIRGRPSLIALPIKR